jgi:hypothetical protein
MDALAEVHKEETRLRDVDLLQSSTILVACSSAGRSSSARPAAPVPHAFSPVVPHAARDESVDLHCDHCGRDGHLEAFCYRKRKAHKAQAHHFSQGTGGTGSGGSERSSTGSETQEILMLLHRLVASTSTGVVGFYDSVLCTYRFCYYFSNFQFRTTFSSFSSTCPWYLDSGASFHMIPHSAHLSSMRPSYRHLTVQTADGSSLFVTGQGTLCSNSFYVHGVSLVPDLTM